MTPHHCISKVSTCRAPTFVTSNQSLDGCLHPLIPYLCTFLPRPSRVAPFWRQEGLKGLWIFWESPNCDTVLYFFKLSLGKFSKEGLYFLRVYVNLQLSPKFNLNRGRKKIQIWTRSWRSRRGTTLHMVSMYLHIWDWNAQKLRLFKQPLKGEGHIFLEKLAPCRDA